MKKILLLLVFTVLVTACKQKYNPQSSGILKSEINQKIQEIMDKAAKSKDDNDKAHLLGDASELLCEKGDYKKALQVARDAKRLNPTDRKALASIAEIYLYERKINEAVVVLQEVLGWEKNYDRANYLIGNAYLFQKKLPQAESHYKEVLNANPDYIHAYLNLAVVYDRKGNASEAMKLLEKAIEKRPNYAEIYKSAGILFEKNGKKPEAKGYYEKYLELNPFGDDVDAVKTWVKNLS